VHFLDLPPNKQQVHAKTFKTGDIVEWARTHIKDALARASALMDEKGPPTFVPSAVQRYADDLHVRGFAGSALAVGGIRIDDETDEEVTVDADPALVAAARAYVTAYDAWQVRLVHPPFNADKGDDHLALMQTSQDAWLTFDRALQERGIETGDRLGLARELARVEIDKEMKTDV